MAINVQMRTNKTQVCMRGCFKEFYSNQNVYTITVKYYQRMTEISFWWEKLNNKGTLNILITTDTTKMISKHCDVLLLWEFCKMFLLFRNKCGQSVDFSQLKVTAKWNIDLQYIIGGKLWCYQSV